jgi:hypothetical protein
MVRTDAAVSLMEMPAALRPGALDGELYVLAKRTLRSGYTTSTDLADDEWTLDLRTSPVALRAPFDVPRSK